MSFEGRVAIVTGAGRGIGKAIAAAFVSEKAHVIMADIGPAKEMRRVAKELSSGSVQVVPMKVDVSRYDQVRKMTADVEASFQRLDILVNNAGI
ncbi:MAG: SDR family NAD(P)-dependent oxidoreductase, partial [Desulfobacterales bacterium]